MHVIRRILVLSIATRKVPTPHLRSHVIPLARDLDLIKWHSARSSSCGPTTMPKTSRTGMARVIHRVTWPRSEKRLFCSQQLLMIFLVESHILLEVVKVSNFDHNAPRASILHVLPFGDFVLAFERRQLDKSNFLDKSQV